MTLRCVGDRLTLQLVVLPCNDPPAIHILLEVDIVSASLEFSFDETVSESQEFPMDLATVGWSHWNPGMYLRERVMYNLTYP